jgi:hypothetical protein
MGACAGICQLGWSFVAKEVQRISRRKGLQKCRFALKN